MCPASNFITGKFDCARATAVALIRVDTRTYKVVHFAFGFEAIESEADKI